MESKHTPGPWQVRKNDPTIIDGKNGGKTYSFAVAETFGYQAQREANARLIATSPELLDTLNLVLKTMYADPNANITMITTCSTTVKNAIAKATGGK